jgi:hypothetical protein
MVTAPLLAEMEAEEKREERRVETQATGGMSEVEAKLRAARMRPVGIGGMTPRRELDHFIAEKESMKFLHTGPMDYWLGKMAVWPHLAPRALAALSRSLTSVDTERYFSTLNWIVGLRRTRLSTGNLASLATIKREMQSACDLALGEGVVIYDSQTSTGVGGQPAAR